MQLDQATRHNIVFFAEQGLSIRQAAKRLGVSRKTVSLWLKRNRDGGKGMQNLFMSRPGWMPQAAQTLMISRQLC